MAELARIEARLESLGQLEELVGALRSMAASRVREAQTALSGTNAYCGTVKRAIGSLWPDADDPPAEGTGRAVLLVITSENGFVGGFNTAITDRAFGLRDPDETLAMVGRRGEILAMERNVSPDLTFSMTSRAHGVTQLSRRIAARLVGASRARIVFAQHKQGGAFDIQERQILPLAPGAITETPPDRPLHHLPVETLLDRLAAEYLFAEIAHSLMESLLSENSARLMTMDSATRNIDETLEKLRRQERAARQEQTTSDMLDVIVGTEAVNHGSGPDDFIP